MGTLLESNMSCAYLEAKQLRASIVALSPPNFILAFAFGKLLAFHAATRAGRDVFATSLLTPIAMANVLTNIWKYS